MARWLRCRAEFAADEAAGEPARHFQRGWWDRKCSWVARTTLGWLTAELMKALCRAGIISSEEITLGGGQGCLWRAEKAQAK